MKNMRLSRAITFFIVILLASLLWAPTPLLAALSDGFNLAKTIATDNDLSTSEPKILVESVIDTLLGFAGLVALAAIIYGGFLYITSAGDEDRAAKGKKVVLYAVIGLILIGLSAVIVNIVIDIFAGGTPSGCGDLPSEACK